MTILIYYFPNNIETILKTVPILNVDFLLYTLEVVTYVEEMNHLGFINCDTLQWSIRVEELGFECFCNRRGIFPYFAFLNVYLFL